MDKINRLKVVLVEKEKSGNGWQNNLENQLVLSANGVAIQHSLTYKHLIKLQTYLM